MTAPTTGRTTVTRAGAPSRIGTVAVLGATGAVGRAVCAMLSRAGVPVRGAARRVGTADLPACVMTAAVDVSDPSALHAFCVGSQVIVNCAAPSSRTSGPVARAAARCGADLVDAGDAHDPADAASPVRVAVRSAGMSPGLSELLLRRVVLGAGDVTTVTTHLGGLDRFAAGGAADYLAGLGPGSGAGLAWRGAGAVPSPVGARHDVDLPPFRGPVGLYPYLGPDTVATLRALGVPDADAFAVFPGIAVRAVLGRVTAAGTGADAVAELRRAAELDLAGRRPYHVLRAVAEGPAGIRTAVLRVTSAVDVAAAVVAVTVICVLAGRVPPGSHRAADVLDPAAAVDEAVRLAGGILRETTSDAGGTDDEEGRL